MVKEFKSQTKNIRCKITRNIQYLMPQEELLPHFKVVVFQTFAFRKYIEIPLLRNFQTLVSVDQFTCQEMQASFMSYEKDGTYGRLHSII